MGVDFPNDYTIDLTLRGGTTVDGDLSLDSDIRVREMPEFELSVNALPEIKIGVTEIPKIQVGVDPVDFAVRIKEVPEIRAHIPANFKLGFSVLGTELMALNLCGEAQVITEDYRANPCERCGASSRQATHDPTAPVVAGNRIDLVNGDG